MKEDRRGALFALLCPCDFHDVTALADLFVTLFLGMPLLLALLTLFMTHFLSN